MKKLKFKFGDKVRLAGMECVILSSNSKHRRPYVVAGEGWSQAGILEWQLKRGWKHKKS